MSRQIEPALTLKRVLLYMRSPSPPSVSTKSTLSPSRGGAGPAPPRGPISATTDLSGGVKTSSFRRASESPPVNSSSACYIPCDHRDNLLLVGGDWNHDCGLQIIIHTSLSVGGFVTPHDNEKLWRLFLVWRCRCCVTV